MYYDFAWSSLSTWEMGFGGPSNILFTDRTHYNILNNTSPDWLSWITAFGVKY